MKSTSLSIQSIYADKRLDGSYHLSEGVSVRNAVKKSPYTLRYVKDGANSIFYGGRAKRIYVKSPKHGIPFLSSSDILLANLNNVKLASRKYMSGIEEMTLEKDWILISRSGTIGNCVYTNEQHAQKLASEDVIRINPNDILRRGYLYAYLASKYGYLLLTQGMFGGVIQHIEPDFVGSLPIPDMPKAFQAAVDDRIKKAALLRTQATKMIMEAERILKEEVGLRNLTSEDYDYFGPRSYGREVSCFSKNIREIGTISFNAFNHSERINKTKQLLDKPTVPLKSVLLDNDVFSTGSFPRVEVSNNNGVMLINQSDIFDNIVKGKHISKRGVNLSKLVEYGEILIAGVGTLGENESFCRVIFANEDLTGQLVSGEFIRLKTTKIVPSGYLFTWLNTDYGFRFMRSLQAGTKLCRPIPQLLLELPIPIIDNDIMLRIDVIIKSAFTKRHEANNLEKEAISMVEAEIDSWEGK